MPGLQRIALADRPPNRDIWVGYHHDLRHMDRLRDAGYRRYDAVECRDRDAMIGSCCKQQE
jgi:hypothetical protein